MIKTENDIRIALTTVRFMANSLSFSNVDIQKVIVAVSELTQNILDHTNTSGKLTIELIDQIGIQVIVEDRGKGIIGLQQIFAGDDRFQKKGLGLGLVGAKRLMDEFQIDTSERGTKIIAIKWKSK